MTAIWTPSRELWTPRKPSLLRKVTDWVRMATAGQTLLNSSGQTAMNSSGQELLYDTGGCGCCGCQYPSVKISGVVIASGCYLSPAGYYWQVYGNSSSGGINHTYNVLASGNMVELPIWGAGIQSGSCPPCSAGSIVTLHYAAFGSSYYIYASDGNLIYYRSAPATTHVVYSNLTAISPGTYENQLGTINTVDAVSGLLIGGNGGYLKASDTSPSNTSTFPNLSINASVTGACAATAVSTVNSIQNSIVKYTDSNGCIYSFYYLFPSTANDWTLGWGNSTANTFLGSSDMFFLEIGSDNAFYFSSTLVGTYTAFVPSSTPSTITVSL